MGRIIFPYVKAIQHEDVLKIINNICIIEKIRFVSQSDEKIKVEDMWHIRQSLKKESYEADNCSCIFKAPILFCDKLSDYGFVKINDDIYLNKNLLQINGIIYLFESIMLYFSDDIDGSRTNFRCIIENKKDYDVLLDNFIIQKSTLEKEYKEEALQLLILDYKFHHNIIDEKTYNLKVAEIKFKNI